MNTQNSKIPKTGVNFYIKIDGHALAFDHNQVSREEILTKAGLNPECVDLYIKFSHGKKEKIDPGEFVDLSREGIEKFRTLPKKLTDGKGGQPPVPFLEEDWSTLDSLNLKYEVRQWKNQFVLYIHEWPVPDGYNLQFVTLAIVIPTTYPSAQLDMFYVSPSLARTSGKPIHAIANQDINGKVFQRWSRHRDGNSKWRPGIDDLGSHLILIESCLTVELGR